MVSSLFIAAFALSFHAPTPQRGLEDTAVEEVAVVADAVAASAVATVVNRRVIRSQYIILLITPNQSTYLDVLFSQNR